MQLICFDISFPFLILQIVENTSMVINIKNMLDFLEDIVESNSPFSMTSINHLPSPDITYDSLLDQPPSKKHSMSLNIEQVITTEHAIANTDQHLSLPPFMIHNSLPLRQTDMQQEFGTNLELPFDENFPSESMSDLLSMLPEDCDLPFPPCLSLDYEPDSSFLNKISCFANEDISPIPTRNSDHDKPIQPLNPILLTQPTSSISCQTNLGCKQYDSYFSVDDPTWKDLIENFSELEDILPTLSVNYESNESHIKNNSHDACQKREIFDNLTDDNQTEHHSDEVPLNSRHSIKTSSNSSGDIMCSCVTQNKSAETCLLEEDHLGHRNHADSGVVGDGMDVAFKSSPLHSTSNSGGEEKYTRAPKNETNSIKKSSKVVKKKSKSGGDAQKQRPRDRQLIQDRMKELRELVPQSEKVITLIFPNLVCFLYMYRCR